MSKICILLWQFSIPFIMWMLLLHFRKNKQKYFLPLWIMVCDQGRSTMEGSHVQWSFFHLCSRNRHKKDLKFWFYSPTHNSSFYFECPLATLFCATITQALGLIDAWQYKTVIWNCKFMFWHLFHKTETQYHSSLWGCRVWHLYVNMISSHCDWGTGKDIMILTGHVSDFKQIYPKIKRFVLSFFVLKKKCGISLNRKVECQN